MRSAVLLLTQANAYFVRPVLNGVEQAASAAYMLSANALVQQHISIPLQIPVGGVTPDSIAYTYNANDCSVGDLDGDGEYEIVLKWDPSNSKDNAQSGYTGNVFLDAYKLDGTRLWRIDLGKNIRAGAHYTQFMVYDLDGDGKAEIACKTADCPLQPPVCWLRKLHMLPHFRWTTTPARTDLRVSPWQIPALKIWKSG